MFSSWQFWVGYALCVVLAVVLTDVFTRRGLAESLERPIEPGFGPPCTLWQAWKLFCSFFWERMLLLGVTVSCAFRLYLGDWNMVDFWVMVAIIAFFPFQEYLTHRFLLHHPPIVIFGKRYETIIALVHRVHHRDPWHMQRAINPPVAIVLYAIGLPLLFCPFFKLPHAMTGVAGSWLVLLVYEWIHLLIHTSHVPRNWLFKRIWRNHRLHHFKSEHFWYNVSTYGVDLLLHTQPTPQSIPTSPTCLTLDERESQEPETATNSPPAIRQPNRRWRSPAKQTNSVKRAARSGLGHKAV